MLSERSLRWRSNLPTTFCKREPCHEDVHTRLAGRPHCHPGAHRIGDRRHKGQAKFPSLANLPLRFGRGVAQLPILQWDLPGPSGQRMAAPRYVVIPSSGIKLPHWRSGGERGIRRAVMIRTAFALLALATLAKNDASGRFRLADACTAIVRAFTDNVSESHSQRFAPMASVCPSRNALAMSGIGPHLFRDVLAGVRVVGTSPYHLTAPSDQAAPQRS